MKNRVIHFCACLSMLLSCEDDRNIVTINSVAEPAVITSLSSDLTRFISQEILSDKVKVEWQSAGYGVNTEVVYTVQLDSKCGTFESPIELGKTTANSITLSLETINAKLLDELGVAPHQVADIKIRVISSVKNKLPTTSGTLEFQVRPWSAKPTALWLQSEEWELPEAPQLLAVSETAYEGYVYFEENTSFKLTTTPVCTALATYGDAGGVLSSNTTANNLSVPSIGYYKINVNTTDLTYQFTKINTWGLIGSATPGSWNTSTPMEYDEANNVWVGSATFTVGALKFRANDWWDINYGPADINSYTGNLIQTNDAVDIKEAGIYTVTIDLSKSVAPHVYTYKVVKDGNAPNPEAPTRLWVPGGYQGFSPSTAPTLTSLSEFVFEGFVNITSSTGVKFTTAPNYDNTNYGYGGASGTLSTSGPDIDIPKASYYRFTVNTSTLTYDTASISSWGMVGPATAGGSDAGWNQSVPMTYNATENVWSAVITLSPGALKFRANNKWDINFGPFNSDVLVGTLIQTNAAITIVEGGSYTVTIDLSKSEDPYQYTYSVVKN